MEKEIEFIFNNSNKGIKIEFNRENKIEMPIESNYRKSNHVAGSEESDIDEFNNNIFDEQSNKRPINYQIEKNKGLTPKRNKLYRNPRVRHREKYRRALIKRKSIIPKVRTETKRYSGETTGIRSNVVKGTKIRV